jgi:hypothetical protein
MYHSHEKCATRIIKKSEHNIILKDNSQSKTFNFDDKLKIIICVTDNIREKHMLSHIFHLRKNDVKVHPRNAWKINYNSKNSQYNTSYKLVKAVQLCA